MYQRQFNILVLDEDTRALYQTVALLKQRDYVVFGAPSVDIAVWMLSQWPFDLLVAALRLGEMNGLDFIAEARRYHPALASVLLGCDGDQVLDADAWQLEASVLIRPLNPALFLTVVAERLAAIRGRQRWPRKTVNANVPVSVDGAPARLVDVSYGGFRLALHNETLSSPMTVAFPNAGLRLRAHLVWSSLAGDGVTCLCGAALAEDAPTADWRRFVDWIPEHVQ